MGRRAGKASKKQKAEKAKKAQRQRQRQIRNLAASAPKSQKKTNRKQTSSPSSSSPTRHGLPNVKNASSLQNNMAPRGLANLGNTCFFNAISQNIAQLKRLRNYFVENDPPKDNEKGMTSEVRKFMHSMWDRNERSVYSPNGLLGEIGKRAPRFRGRQQQDAHEALRFILDGLIEEEEQKKKDADQRMQIRTRARRRSSGDDTFVQSTFKGVLASTITCRECFTSSTVTEPFYDLSVPLVPIMPDDEVPGNASRSTNLTKAHNAVEESSRAVMALPPPPSSSTLSNKETRDNTQNVSVPKSVHEELLQKVKTFSPVESEAGDVEDVPLLSNDVAMQGDSESDAEEGLAELADIFTMDLSKDTAGERTRPKENPVVAGPVVAGPVDAVAGKAAREGTAMQPSRLFSLPFLRGRGIKYKSLEECIGEFTKAEILDGSNAYGCEECTRRKHRAMLYAQASSLMSSSLAEDDMSEITSDESPDAVVPGVQDSTIAGLSGLDEQGVPLGSSSPITSSESDDDDEMQRGSRIVRRRGRDGITDRPRTRIHNAKKKVGEISAIPTVRTTAEKRLEIRSAPPCLVVQLKRFQQVSLRGASRKISGHVEFPTELDLSKFMEQGKLVTKSQGDRRGGVRVVKESSIYRLSGVVVHGGSLFGGHYTAYVRSGATERTPGDWYFCNDSKTSKVTEKDVLSAEAYILLYERV